MTKAYGFHNNSDVIHTLYQGQKTSGVVQHTTKTLKISYRFYPHFHPYIRELVQRLSEKSVPGLQAADTEYIPNEDGTFEILPDSTLVALSDDLTITFSDGNQLLIPQGTQIFLPDKTLIGLASGSGSVPSVPLPGSMVWTESRSMRFSVANQAIEVAKGDTFTLNSDAHVSLPDDQLVTLKSGTKVVFQSCKPKPKLYEDIFSETQYGPSELVEHPYPVNDLDFTSGGAYSVYNWELFYHIPLTLAIHLSKNGHFEEALQWLRYIVDFSDDSEGPTPDRYWKVKPFQYTDVKLIEEILVNLSTGTDPKLRDDTINSIQEWKNKPFRPYAVARHRQTEFMFKAVMTFLDICRDAGDSLFSRDTPEDIAEAAMQYYVPMANILGPRPQEIPKKGSVRLQTYANFRADLNEFGNVLVDLETDIPFDLAPHPGNAAGSNGFYTLDSLGKTLYFCVPRNAKLISYWDTVADRLFKIRNSLNIQGVFRQLPLWEPPIDPGLLAKAVVAGVDVAGVISGVNQPLPLVRFQFLVQKAAEICQEVKSLGSNLLSALEKEDNEALAILRAKHERTILQLAETVKYSQLQDAIKGREGLEKSLVNAVQRYTYYERLLGKQESEIQIPSLDTLDKSALEQMKLKVTEPEVALRTIDVDIAQDVQGVTQGKKVSSNELEELNKMADSQTAQDVAAGLEGIGAFLNLIPQTDADVKPIGVGAGIQIGGMNLSQLFSGLASISRAVGSRATYEANNAAKIGSYARREQEWAFQSNLAAGEMTQIFKQLRGAQIREAMAEVELKNHQQQITFAEQVESFLTDERNGKKTNQAFYAWLKRELQALSAQSFRLAFEVAKKAERALQHELGNPDLSFIQFDYLAGKEGLLAGEKLFSDIKEMEMAYHDLNQREYELTKHVSLLQVDPIALIRLRATGSCTVYLSEGLYDLDRCGDFFLRTKTVAVSIPSITGPLTSVNCKLTLLASSIRKSALLSDDGYVRQGPEDDRFSDYFGSTQAIVTSSAQNDSGLFETNLHDERYLPFEGSGAISQWQIDLPPEVRQFDYDTIADVILHIRYTAREGGELLRAAAAKNLTDRIEDAQSAGSGRLFSVRHEFPTEWAKFKNATVDLASNPKTLGGLTLTLRDEHYPYWSHYNDNDSIVLRKMELFAVPSKDPKRKTADPINVYDDSGATHKPDPLALQKGKSSLGKIREGHLDNVNLPNAIGEFSLYFDDNSMEDLLLVLTWGK